MRFSPIRINRNPYPFLMLSLLVCPTAMANTYQQQAVVSAVSDWLYHGVSESAGEAAFGINGELQLDNRVFLGAEVHQAWEQGPRQRQRSVAGYIGYGWSWSDHWLASVSYTYRGFIDSVKEWNYGEWSAHLSYSRERNSWSIDVDYANDYYDHDTEALIVEANYAYAFNRRWYGDVGAGVAELSSARHIDYHYAHAGLGYAVDRWVVDVAYHWHSEAGQRLFGYDLESPSWVMSLTYQWF